MRIAIVGNGDFVPASTRLVGYDYVIAADGGLRHCRALGITPNHCVGDGDSLTPGDKVLPLVTIDAHQNTTDLQKALAAADHVAAQQPYQVDLFSVTSGDRLDHTLFALQTLAEHTMVEAIYTPHQIIRCLRQQYTWQHANGRTISVLPVALTATVSLTGFAWSGATVTLNAQRPGISNIITAETASVVINSGAVYSFEPSVWS